MTLKLKLLNMACAALMSGGMLVTPAFAASSSSKDIKPPIICTAVGGGGTAFVLIGMSRTKKKKIEADDRIDLSKSQITRSSTDYSSTVCTHRNNRN